MKRRATRPTWVLTRRPCVRADSRNRASITPAIHLPRRSQAHGRLAALTSQKSLRCAAQAGPWADAPALSVIGKRHELARYLRGGGSIRPADEAVRGI